MRTPSRNRFLVVLSLLSSVTLFACTEQEPVVPEQGALEIVGEWESNFGGFELISETRWGSGTIVSYDNELNYAITQNASDAAFGPDKFNKIVWTDISDKAFYYCWVEFGLDSAQEAEDGVSEADPSDPANSGCGDFAWTRLFEPLEVRGIWATSFASTDLISSSTWGAGAVIRYDNEANWVVTQNPSDDPFGPSKFNKIVWTEKSASSFYYCWIDFGLDTALAAQNSANTADATDPENSGCGDFGWTHVVPAVELHGSWNSNFGGTEVIDSFVWGTATMTKYDNDANFAITQNPEDAEYSPSKFNKIVWTEPKDGSVYYCTIDFGLETADDAEQTSKTADDSDPDNSGCGDFSWTKLTAK